MLRDVYFIRRILGLVWEKFGREINYTWWCWKIRLVSSKIDRSSVSGFEFMRLEICFASTRKYLYIFEKLL